MNVRCDATIDKQVVGIHVLHLKRRVRKADAKLLVG